MEDVQEDAMSDSVLVALIAGGSLIVANLVISVLTGNRQSKQLVEIRTSTDGNLTRVSNALDEANLKIAGLERLVTSMVANKKRPRS